MKSNYSLIKNYIKILLENIEDVAIATDSVSTDLQDLENKYRDEIESKNKSQIIQNKLNVQSGKGWDLMNTTIQKLKQLDDPTLYEPGQDIIEIKINMLEDILTRELGFNRIGEGFFRHVWGHPSANFIIKVEKKVLQYKGKGSDLKSEYALIGSNQNEYNNYYNVGNNLQSKTELFPKMYAYDQKDKIWMIFEKVNTFENQNGYRALHKIFAPFALLLQRILWVLEHEPAFESYQKPSFVIKPDVYSFLSNDNPLGFFNLTFKSSLSNINKYVEASNDLQFAFHKMIIDLIINNILLDGKKIARNPKLYQLLQKKLNQNLGQDIFTPTPDALYICRFLKDAKLEDLNLGNMGYRDLKNNPKEPWKNLIILDFAGYGPK